MAAGDEPMAVNNNIKHSHFNNINNIKQRPWNTVRIYTTNNTIKHLG